MPTKSLLLSLLLTLLSVFYLSDARAANQDDNPEFDAHATAFIYFFNDTDMDFHFGNLILSSIVNKGAETGEAFYYALQRNDVDKDKVVQPVLLIVGEGEFASQETFHNNNELSIFFG